MRKTIFTLNINYSPDITSITYPYIERYAEKIGATFQIINKRKFLNMPIVYEKLQIYELGQNNDWNIYIDSDALIHPNMFDITEFLPKDTTMTYDADFAIGRFKYDNYFRRDGRAIGVGNWFTVASNWCIDLWKPLDIPFEEKNIYLTQDELSIAMKPSHLIDDYTLSRNIAKYGLKHVTFLEYFKDRIEPKSFFHHNYFLTELNKEAELKEIVSSWKLTP